MAKRENVLLISFMLLNFSILVCTTAMGKNNNYTNDTIKVICSPDLYNLSIMWANEYNKAFPEQKIKIISVSDVKMAGNLISAGNLGFVSREYISGIINESVWKVVIGRDIIVPVINSKNPYSDLISQQGISPEELGKFLTDSKSGNWGTLLNSKQTAKANYYRINDEFITKGIEGFLNINQLKTDGIEVSTIGELTTEIQKDPYAIGFCKMVNLLDSKNQSIAENIRLLPIDRNGNNVIDYNEKIYDDFNVFSRGVWIGKYPKSLFSNIYSVSSDQPENKNGLAFIKWIITDGQQFLYGNGYSDLLVSERQTTVDKLNTSEIASAAVTGNKSLSGLFLLITGILAMMILLFGGSLRYLRQRNTSEKLAGSVIQQVLDENSLVIPRGIYFDKTHTWAFMEQNGVVRIGIDDFLQHITGDITRIKMKNPGEKIKKGETILSIIQNGKQLNLYSPVSGVIKKQNERLKTNSSLINSSPYDDGWVYMIEPTNWLRENQLLFMAEKQKQFIKKEFSRLRDFLALTLKSDTAKYSQVILQDGGELRDGVLSNLGPKTWEDFQTNFIDPSRQIWFYEII